MRKTYAEYLKSIGASEEDIKLLDTPVGRKAYEAQVAAVETAEAAKTKAENHSRNMQDWYDNTALPEHQAAEREVIAAKAEAGKFRTALRTAADRGLIDLTKDLGIDNDANPSGPAAAAAAAATPPDPAKRDYFTKEEVAAIADREGDAIALAADISREHQLLFPDTPLNFRELRREAVTARKPVETLWMEKYGVVAARTARAERIQRERDEKIREEGRAELRAKYAEGVNPAVQTPMPSNSPFTVRKRDGDLRSKQPWEIGNENSLSDERVRRVATKVLTQ